MNIDWKYNQAQKGSAAMNLEQLQVFAARSPYHQWLGFEVTALKHDGIEVRVPWREELVSNPRRLAVHGGVLAALIDATAAYAITARLGISVPTVDLRCDYHAVAHSGGILVVRGRVLHLGRTLATAEAQIVDERDVLVASGRGTYFVAQHTSSDE